MRSSASTGHNHPLRALWRHRFRVSTLLQILLAGHAVLLLALFAVAGPSDMVDLMTVWLCLLLDAWLFFSLQLADRQSFPHIFSLVLFFLWK